jgi:hypothetical protein
MTAMGERGDNGDGLVWRKASRCTDATCVEVAWRKSTYSGVNGCVEVVTDGEGTVQVRDSKDPDGPHLQFSPEEWDAFIQGIKAGEFDHEGTG